MDLGKSDKFLKSFIGNAWEATGIEPLDSTPQGGFHWPPNKVKPPTTGTLYSSFLCNSCQLSLLQFHMFVPLFAQIGLPQGGEGLCLFYLAWQLEGLPGSVLGTVSLINWCYINEQCQPLCQALGVGWRKSSVEWKVMRRRRGAKVEGRGKPIWSLFKNSIYSHSYHLLLSFVRKISDQGRNICLPFDPWHIELFNACFISSIYSISAKRWMNRWYLLLASSY